MDINNKILEAAMQLFAKPMTSTGQFLQTLELMGRVKEIYQMGFEDGRKQKEADEIIKLAESGRD
jgi:hypothetical protein